MEVFFDGLESPLSGYVTIVTLLAYSVNSTSVNLLLAISNLQLKYNSLNNLCFNVS